MDVYTDTVGGTVLLSLLLLLLLGDLSIRKLDNVASDVDIVYRC